MISTKSKLATIKYIILLKEINKPIVHFFHYFTKTDIREIDFRDNDIREADIRDNRF